MFLVLVNLDRAEFGHVFLRGETRVATVGQQDDPDDDQDNPENSSGLHKRRTLERAPSGDQVHDQNNDRDDEQQMDKRATEMTDESEQPKNQQHNEDSPEHKVFL